LQDNGDFETLNVIDTTHLRVHEDGVHMLATLSELGLGNYWPVIFTPFLVLILPMFTFLRNYRLEYLASLCGLAIVGILILGVRNYREAEAVAYEFGSIDGRSRSAIRVDWIGSYWYFCLERSPMPPRGLVSLPPNGPPQITWSHPASPGVLTDGTPLTFWAHGGFIINHREFLTATVPYVVWQVILPNWFLVASLSVFPLYCLRLFPRRKHKRNAYRLGLCENFECRYDLRGTVPLDDGRRRCPECGHLNAISVLAMTREAD